MWSLQFGELPAFCGVIGKLIIGEDRPGNNIRSHIQPFASVRPSLDLLNPLAPPGGRLDVIREILRLVHDLFVAELHNTHGAC